MRSVVSTFGRKIGLVFLMLLAVASAAVFAAAAHANFTLGGFSVGMTLDEAKTRLHEGEKFVQYKDDYRAIFSRKEAQGDEEFTVSAGLDTQRIEIITRLVRYGAERPFEQLQADLVRSFGPAKTQASGADGMHEFCWGSCNAAGKPAAKQAGASLKVVIGGYGTQTSNYALYELRGSLHE